MPDDQRSRMLAIILGASIFPNAPNLAEGRAFYISAADLREYLCDERGLALPRRNILSLFDDSRSPSEQLMEVASFLLGRDLELKNEGTRVEDLLIYYVGHGLFARGDQGYCLAVRSTNQINEGATSIRAGDLAGVIKDKAAFSRRYLILDCCFAANIHKEFQSSALSAVRVQIAKEFPERGTALLCSSNAHVPSLAPKGLDRTMFSNALIQALRQGHEAAGPRLSFSELGALISENIRNAYPDDYVRPEVHSPDQREGDIAHIPLFPNPAWREQATGEQARRGQERQKQAAAERARRKAEKERIAADEALAREKAEAREKERRAKEEQEERAKRTAEMERLARKKAEQEQAREKAEAERLAKEKVEQERVAREKAEKKQAQEKAEAEQFAQKKAEQERNAWLTHVNRGNALKKKGDVKAAIAEYQEAIRLDPENDIPRVNLADALDGIGKLDEAMTECRQALRLKPDSVEAHYRLGLFYYENHYVGNLRKDLSSAIAEYWKALRLNPKHALAHHSLAEALQKKGDSIGALEHFRIASELEPKNSTFRDDYQQLTKAEAKRAAEKAEAERVATETAAQDRVASKHAEAGKTVDLIQSPREPAKMERLSQPLIDQEQLFSQSAEVKRRGPTAIEVCVGLAVAVILAASYWTCHTSPPAPETTSQPGSTAHLHSAGVANSDPKLFRKATRPAWQDLVIPQGTSIEIELVRTIKLPGQNRDIESVTFSPDGRLLASASVEREQTSLETVKFSNGSVQLWDAESGALVRVLQSSVDGGTVDSVKDVVFSPDSRLVVASASAVISPPSPRTPAIENRNQNVQIWETGSGKLLKNFQTKEWGYGFDQLAFSSDGHLLVGASGADAMVPIWDLDSGTLVRQLDHPNSAVAVAFQPKSHVLAVADNDQRQGVRLWDVDGGTLLHSLHSNPPSYGSVVAFSPDGETLATGHANGRLHLWDVREGRITRTLRVADRKDVLAVAFSPDGRILASTVSLPRGGFMVCELQLWNPSTGERLSLSANPDLIGRSLAFDPAEPLLALASDDGIKIWKLKASPK